MDDLNTSTFVGYTRDIIAITTVIHAYKAFYKSKTEAICTWYRDRAQRTTSDIAVQNMVAGEQQQNLKTTTTIK